MAASVPTVLLVEDNPTDARLLQEMVTRSGKHDLVLKPCRRLADALAAAAEAPADCVLLDLSLPDATGLDGVSRLRERFPDLPIVILTGLADEDLALEALHAGVQDYLVKGAIEGDGVKRAIRYAIERKRAEIEAARLGRQNELILDSAGDGICGIDAHGVVTFANPAAGRILRRDREMLLGAVFHDVVHGGADDAFLHEAAECPLDARRVNGNAMTVDDEEFWRADGSSFPVEYVATALSDSDGAVISFKDITERKRAEAQLQYLADHDVLTGLFNRRRLGEELDRQAGVVESLGVHSALLVVDIDNFKFVNDALGHPAGDELLRGLATQLRERIRKTDVVARLSGDEFGVLVAGATNSEALALANDLAVLVGGHRILAREKPVQVSASIGITMLDRPGLTAERLLMEADVALHEAKSGGGESTIMFAREAGSRSGQRPGFIWTDRIKRALDEDQFVVYGQPIAALGGGDSDRYELLIRMREEDGTIVPPAAFLPVAERFGLISSIDVWMIRKAISLIEQELEADRRLVLEVNLSGHSITDPELPDLIEDALIRSPIDPSQLVFEITETAAIANMEEARALASRIRRWGCRFALDDFGAGFGSFYYLKYLPVDYLKIDGEFIRSLDSSEIDQRMVVAMVQIARALGLQTIAEFVENDAVLKQLREFGVDFVQGHHVGRPAPVGEILPVRLAGAR